MKIRLPGPIGKWTLRKASSGHALWMFPLDYGCTVKVRRSHEKPGEWGGYLERWFAPDYDLKVRSMDRRACQRFALQAASDLFMMLDARVRAGITDVRKKVG